MIDRVALYPGSFDPPTFGHLDLIQRALKMFPHVVVAVAQNNEKNCLFTVEERVDFLRTLTRDLRDVEVTSFRGLTAVFAEKCKAAAIVRGLRAISDFEYEYSMAVTNKKLNPLVDTVCLMPSEQYLFVSSRIVKEIARNNGDVNQFVPPLIAKKLMEKFTISE
jgi:pantetheine-phosphate adenylyltransferase